MEHHGPLLAEQSATGIGAAIGAVVAIGGYLWSARASKTDSASQLVSAAVALVSPLQARLDHLEEELRLCNERHLAAEQALQDAGLL